MSEAPGNSDRKNRSRRHHWPAKPREFPNIFFCGDPHGEFSQINEAARLYKPDAMVILGDLQPPAPLHEVLEEALAFSDIWWIPGNHDTDTDDFYDFLWRSELSRHNLHGRVANVAGLLIGGLGGVFRGQVWMPDDDPNYFCPSSFIRRLGSGNLWRGGLPRRHRTTIFPSVYQNLYRQRADILVTHEAAGCHRKGFAAIDRLGRSLGVKWMFHGHQHEERVYGQHMGMTVRAVGYRGVVNLKGEVVIAAQMDPREAAALQSAIDWANHTMGSPESPLIVREWGRSEGVSAEIPARGAPVSVPEEARPSHDVLLGCEVARQTPGGRFKRSPAPEEGGASGGSRRERPRARGRSAGESSSAPKPGKGVSRSRKHRTRPRGRSR